MRIMGKNRDELVNRVLALKAPEKMKVLNLILEAYESGNDAELAHTITLTLEWCDKLFD